MCGSRIASRGAPEIAAVLEHRGAVGPGQVGGAGHPDPGATTIDGRGVEAARPDVVRQVDVAERSRAHEVAPAGRHAVPDSAFTGGGPT